MDSRRAYRVMAVIYAIPAGVLVTLAFSERQALAGSLALAPLFAVCAVGLWRLRAWGRTLALLVAFGNAGVATLGLLGAILSSTPVLGPLLFLLLNGGIVFALSREWFSLPGEIKQ